MVPGAGDQDVITGVELLWAKSKAPDRVSFTFVDGHKFTAIFVSEQDFTRVERDGEDLTVWGPVTVQALRLGGELVDVTPLSLPKTEVGVCAGGKTL